MHRILRPLIHIAYLGATLLFGVTTYGDIRGTVIDGDGRPIEGATVTVSTPAGTIDRMMSWRSGEPRREPVASAETDSKGNYAIELERAISSIVLDISASGHFPIRTVVPHVDWVGAALLRKAELASGRVLAGGDPVPEALVVLSASSGAELLARTDAEGVFTIPKPPPGSGDSIAVIHPDYVPLREPWRSGDDLTLRLKRGQAISARAVGPDGEAPIAGAQVAIDGWPVATTDEEGEFTVAHAPEDWSEAQIRKDNLVASVRRSTAKAANVSLKRGSTVSGTIVDAASGRFVPDVRISLMQEGPFGRIGVGEPLLEAVSDKAGRFALSGVLPGAYLLITSHPAWTDASEQITVLGDDDMTRRLQLQPTASVSGLASNDQGKPVAAAFITTRQVESRSRFRMRRFRGASSNITHSAPDGKYVIFDVDPDEEIRVEGSHPAYPSARTDTFDPEPGELITGKSLVFPQGLALTGTVMTADGVPVSGARIYVNRSERGFPGMRIMRIGGSEMADPALTDAKGQFNVRVEQGRWNILAEAKGFASTQLSAVEVDDAIEPLEITLEEGAVIRGRVLRDGSGVAGVMVTVIANQQPREPVTTGPDGSFVLDDLPRGTAMLVAAKPDEFIQEMRSIEAPTSDLLIEIPAGGTIRGRVVDAAGDPVSDFQAGLNPERGGGGMRVRLPGSMLSFHSEDGEFVLENVPPGRIEVMVEAPGFLEHTVRGVELEAGETIDDLVVELDRGVRITGTVRGPDARPLPGATVTIQRDEENPLAMLGLGSNATTDSSGSYTIAAAEPGETTLVFAKDGLPSARKTVELSGEETVVDVTLEEGQIVRGTVTTSSGAPVAGASVRATGSTQSGRFNAAETDANGQFTFEGLEAGRYTFTAQHDDYVTAVERDVDISASQSIRLVMGEGGTITGRVLGVDRNDYASISVRAHSDGPAAVSAVSPDGTFRIEGVKPGTASVSAHMNQMLENRSSTPVTVEVTAGATSSVDLEFAGGSTVTGKVTKYGEPLRSGVIQMIPEGRTMQLTSKVDTSGNYTIEGVPTGKYELVVVDLQTFSPFTKTVEVRSESETFDIDIRGGRVSGRITESGTNEPLENVSVVLEPADREQGRRYLRLAATSSASGEFVIDSVPEGSYRLLAERSGYGHGTRDVFVTEGRDEAVELSLTPSSGLSMRVVDRRDGRPLSVDVAAYDMGNQVVWEGRPSPREDGEIRVPVAAGTYRVRVSASGYAPSTVQLTTPGPTETIGLGTGGTLVINSSSAARRTVQIIDGWGLPARGGRWNRSGEEAIDPGTNTIDRLAPGQYTIRVLGTNGAATETRSVTVREGETTTISIQG